jgi:large subunit ribosomal protein L23
MNVLRKPIVTEKMTAVASLKNPQYGFVVTKDANKIQIRQEVEKIYGVNVQSISTMIVYGKKRNRSTKSRYITGKTPTYKKAVVTLAEGQEIDFYKNI